MSSSAADGTGGFPAGSVGAAVCVLVLAVLMIVGALVAHLRYKHRGGLSPSQEQIMRLFGRDNR
jgi:hypothetical protein